MCWLWYVGTSQIRALHMGLLAIFPKAAPASHYPCACARSQQQLLVSFKDFCEQACLETPRPVKAKACQQPKGPASSSKEISQAWHNLSPLSRDTTFVSWNWSNWCNSAAKPGCIAWTASWNLWYPLPHQGLSGPCMRLSKTKLLSGLSLKSHSLLSFPWPLGHK